MKRTTAMQWSAASSPWAAATQRSCIAAGLLVAGAACLLAAPAARAEPAPVAPGLWEVQMLALFQPDPQPGATHWPGLPNKQRARTYRICLDAPRARAPMSMPQWSSPVQRVSDDMSVTVRQESTPGATGEWIYRRLSEREFEGSQSLAGDAGIEMTLQYRSVYVQRDCAGLAPTQMSKFGEP